MKNWVLGKEEILNRIKKSLGSNYVLLSPITDETRVTEKVRVKCLKHNHEYEVVLRNLWKKYKNNSLNCCGCSFCRGSVKLSSYDEVGKQIYEFNPYYSLVSSSDGKLIRKNSTKLTLKYLPAKNDTFITTTYNNFFNRGRRFKVAGFTSETIVRRVLDINHIKYIPQYPIELDNTKMFVDFYLPKSNSFLEIDGLQHYSNDQYFYQDDDEYKHRVNLDRLKDKYVDSHTEYNMIRIVYDNHKPIKWFEDRIVENIQALGYPIDVSKTFSYDLCDNTDYYLKVLDFYECHSRDETEKRFKISQAILDRLAKTFWGNTKNKYLAHKYHKDNWQEVAEYYLTHSREDTSKKFKTSQTTIDQAFVKVFGFKKSSYLGYHPNRFHK